MPGDQIPQVSIKTELGSSFKRLPSFRLPRDLKLSEFRELPSNSMNESKTRKVFIPNLNVQRKKTEDKVASSPSQTNDAPKANSKERGRREEGSRGRGRKGSNFVRLSGVFSEGFAPTLKSSGWRSNMVEPSSSMPKPKLNLNESARIDKEEEDLVMKELMRDEFLDDPELLPDVDNCPVHLPLQQCKFIDLKNEEPSPEKVKTPELLPNGIKVKQEPGVFNSFQMNIDAEEKPVDIQNMKPLTIPQLLSRSSDKNFIFFQIPSCVPKLKLNVPQTANPNLKKPGQKPNEEIEDTEKYVLRTLPPGRIGTLQIRKSGRTRLLLGGVKLSVESGTQAAFKQDLISVNLDSDTKSGNMVNLGSLTTRMIVTPEWESLLNKN